MDACTACVVFFVDVISRLNNAIFIHHIRGRMAYNRS